MNESNAISIENLVKSYGRVKALRGVDLQVHRGEIFGFLGPNGAGKTTTIRCMLDLIRPDSGILRVLGIDPQTDPVAVRARIGYLPGELHFDQNMKVESILRFFNDLGGDKADWAFVRQLAERLDLDLHTTVKNLSKGNKQKVGVVQALMSRPELLLLDEPTSGLDPLVSHEVLRMIEEARQAGATVFFSSHILSEVQEIADRVGIIRLGKIVEVTSTEGLINRSLRRVRVRFKQPVADQNLERLPGVKVIARDDGESVLLQVEGEMDALIKTLAAYPISDFETERPSLEEIFIAYYEGDGGQAKPSPEPAA
jgi:ABC-2 type transport system ATP-binding protein